MKRIISLVLVCLMVVTLLPVTVFAADETEIASAEDFAKIADNLSGNYKLTQDIAITTPLSHKNESAVFKGTFDGNGHKITVDIVDNDRARSALFCTVGKGCTIKDLTVVGTVKSTGNSTAGLIGTVIDNGTVTVENVTVDVDILDCNNAHNGQGGFIGAVENSPTVVIKNCTNKGAVQGENAGGFIGKVHGDAKIEMTDCVNEGAIESLNLYADYRGAGGFIGCIQNGGCTLTIKNCTNKGTITAKYIPANAYVGHNNASTKNIEGCTNTGKVISGGLELPAEQATGNVQGIWGSARFGFDFDSNTLSGRPNFHALPDLAGAKVYINGTELVADKYSIANDKDGNRQLDISANVAGLYDGYVSITIIWASGTYSTFGTEAPSKADADKVNNASATLEGKVEATVDLESVTSTNPLRNDGKVDPHGSEKNLFTGNNDKYEGWKLGATEDPVKVYFKLNEATKLSYYAIGTGNDDASFPGRQLVEWKLLGSADGQTYVELDYVKDYDFPNVNNKLIAFECETDTAYQYYAVEFIKFDSENSNPGNDVYVQVGEIKLYKACEHVWGEPVVVDKECEKDGSSTVTCTKCGKEEVTVLKHEGHKFVDGNCTECGAADPSVGDNPTTGDMTLVLMLISLVTLLSTALFVAKKRSLVK